MPRLLFPPRLSCILAGLLFAMALCVPAALCTPAAAAEPSGTAENWPRFRGPNGSGVSETPAPAEWTKADYNWQVPLPGAGHSSPVIWGERIFLASADEASGTRYLLCIAKADGKVLWQETFELTAHKKHKVSSYASSTPALDARIVYLLWQAPGGESVLYAFSHDGEQRWKHSLGPFQGGHGSGVSPIVYRDLVIVPHDHDGAGFLAAIDSKTGKERWKVERESSRAQYSTPCIYEPEAGEPQVIFTDMHHGITAVGVESGLQLWEVAVFGTFKQRAIGSPLVAGDLVIGMSGFTTAKKNVVAVRPQSRAQGYTAEEVYRVSQSAPHIPTPLIYNNRMFLWSDRGIVTCVDATDGREIWQERVGGNYFASPVCAGGRIFNVDRLGNVVVLAASDEFQKLAENSLGEGSLATPALAGGTIYFRTLSHLIAIGKK